MAPTQQPALFGGRRTVQNPFPPYPVIGPEEVHAVSEVLLTRQLSECTRGWFTGQMEDAYAGFSGTCHCLSFASGTAAIHSALFALGVGPCGGACCCCPSRRCRHRPWWTRSPTRPTRSSPTSPRCSAGRNSSRPTKEHA